MQNLSNIWFNGMINNAESNLRGKCYVGGLDPKASLTGSPRHDKKPDNEGSKDLFRKS